MLLQTLYDQTEGYLPPSSKPRPPLEKKAPGFFAGMFG